MKKYLLTAILFTTIVAARSQTWPSTIEASFPGSSTVYYPSLQTLNSTKVLYDYYSYPDYFYVQINLNTCITYYYYYSYQTAQTSSGSYAGCSSIPLRYFGPGTGTNRLIFGTSINTQPLSCTVSSTPDLLCSGSENGELSVSVTGGSSNLSYSWSNGSSTQSITGLGAGQYTVTISDGSESTTCSATLNESEEITVFVRPTKNGVKSSTSSGNSGFMSITKGGSSPYSYNWVGPLPSGNSASTDSNPGSLSKGSYILYVEDDEGCSVNSGPFHLK